MKNLSIHFIFSIITIFLFCSCANWGGENPVGVTGGSDHGYGSITMPLISDEVLLIGSWRYDIDLNYDEYRIYSFAQNKSFIYQYYWFGSLNTSYSGTYSIENDELTLNRSSGSTYHYKYIIRGNELIIDGTIYYRIN